MIILNFRLIKTGNAREALCPIANSVVDRLLPRRTLISTGAQREVLEILGLLEQTGPLTSGRLILPTHLITLVMGRPLSTAGL